MEITKIITSVNINSPFEILKKIVVFNSDIENSTKKITIHISLSTGFSYRGIPLKIDSDDNVIFTSLEKTISFINLRNLVAIEILEPMGALEVLTDGAYFEISEADLPTNLELKRTFKDKSDALKSSFGCYVSTDILDNRLLNDVEKYQIKKFSIILEEIINQIAEDDLGEKALQHLKEIKIIRSEQAIVIEKRVNQLEIGINFTNKFSTDFKQQLKSALESKI